MITVYFTDKNIDYGYQYPNYILYIRMLYDGIDFIKNRFYRSRIVYEVPPDMIKSYMKKDLKAYYTNLKNSGYISGFKIV
jgi:hypothetical protein